MSYPACRITINGQLASGVFISRLISCRVDDNEGVSSDTCNIVLNSGYNVARPEPGAIIKIWMGYGVAGMVFMGTFEAEEVEEELLPYQITITGKATGMNDKKKQHRERHWDQKPLKDIVAQVASENGLEAKVDEDIGSHFYEWIAQQNESDIHFLERLAKRHGAIFSVKDQKLIFAAKGTGKSPSGADLTPIVITPEIVKPGSTRIRFTGRTKYKAVKASYTDRREGRKKDVEEPCDDGVEPVYRIPEQFADEAEAKRAAKAKSGDLLRRQVTFCTEIIGDPTARSGAPLTFARMKHDIDGIPFLIGKASHSYSKSGLTTSLSGESKNGGKK